MKFVIFGAGSLVGLELVQQALQQGHKVVAVVRGSEERFLPTAVPANQLTVVVAEVPPSVSDLIVGADVVFSAFVLKRPTERRHSMGLDAILAAMTERGIQRLVALAGEGVLQATDDKLIMQLPGFSPKFHLSASEHLAAFTILSQSETISWTLVCAPPVLPSMNPPPEDDSSYSVKADFLPDWRPGDSGTVVSRAGDVARFMLREAVKNQFVGMRVGITSKIRPGA